MGCIRFKLFSKEKHCLTKMIEAIKRVILSGLPTPEAKGNGQ